MNVNVCSTCTLGTGEEFTADWHRREQCLSESLAAFAGRMIMDAS